MTTSSEWPKKQYWKGPCSTRVLDHWTRWWGPRNPGLVCSCSLVKREWYGWRWRPIWWWYGWWHWLWWRSWFWWCWCICWDITRLHEWISRGKSNIQQCERGNWPLFVHAMRVNIYPDSQAKCCIGIMHRAVLFWIYISLILILHIYELPLLSVGWRLVVWYTNRNLVWVHFQCERGHNEYDWGISWTEWGCK